MMSRSDEQRAVTGGSNSRPTREAGDAESASRGEALRELFFLAGDLAARGLAPEHPTLAAAVHARHATARDYPHILAKELGPGWAESVGSVASWFSKLERWYNRVHAGGGKVRLFEGGRGVPGSETKLSAEGNEFF